MEIVKYTGEDWLVDVPVKIHIWIREECQRMQFEVLKRARPSIVFLSSDGGRNEEEWKIINKNRLMFDTEIDWNCTVYKFYEDRNNGLYTMGQKTKVIWDIVDRCIFLEDDIIPSVSWFRFCAEMLEKYRDDERIECVCGHNHVGVWEGCTSDYFFSRQGSIWGFGVWRRTSIREQDFSYGNDPYIMRLLRQRTRHNYMIWRRIKAYAKQEYYEGHKAAGEFWYEFDMYAQNRLQIIPKYNLINNMGCDEKSTHSGSEKYMTKEEKSVFHMKTYELDFPLKHPKFVLPDIDYEKARNKKMGYNTPLIVGYRKIIRWFRMAMNGELGYLFKRLNEKARGIQKYEK